MVGRKSFPGCSYSNVFSDIGAILRNTGLAETLFCFSVVFIICGIIFDQRSIDLVFPEILGGIKTQMAYVKLMLIGLLITMSLK